MSTTKSTRTPPDGWLNEYAVETRDVPKVILAGLKSAGVKAEQGKVWRGKFPTMLDLVIDINCPVGHLSRDRMSFAKVRLLVDPHEGTLTVHRDEDLSNGCPHCDQSVIDRWLVTCRGHHENGHPDHKPGWISVDDFSVDMPNEEIVRIIPGGDEVRHDDSPMGHVFAAMEKADDEAQARRVVTDPEKYAKALRDLAEENGWSTEGIAEDVARSVERAKVLLRTGPKQIGSTEVVIETEESVMKWLAEQKVPPSLGVNAAWDLVKHLPDCPTQALMRKVQAKRKG